MRSRSVWHTAQPPTSLLPISFSSPRRRARRSATKNARSSVSAFADVDWKRFDFVDLGCSKGGSLDWCGKRFEARRGLGVDLDPGKVHQTLEAGFDAVVADATELDIEDAVRFVSMMDFLEHLPGLDLVEASIERAASVATDFIFIRHPSFEGEGFLEGSGVRQYWWRWSGHTAHPQVADYCGMFERIGLRQYTILYREPVHDSSHPSILPLDAPVNQHAFDPAVHSRKPEVKFERPLWRMQDILVALRPFSASDWAKVVAAVGR